MFYFASDGSYGSADDLYMVDTTGFTRAMWDAIMVASDSSRASLAIHLKNRVHFFPKDQSVQQICDVCDLSIEELSDES